MSEELPDRVTAEYVKEVIRRYGDQNVPGWACAGVSFRLGEPGASVTESLVVLPDPVTNPTASEVRRVRE